jgi:hypothetical protein
MNIRDLRDMTLGHRVMLTAVIVIVLLLLLAAFGYLTGRWDEAGAQAQTLPAKGTFVDVKTPWDAEMLILDKEALAAAYRLQLEHLFTVWMKDDAHQPQRAITGARQARRAFILVRQEIEKREKHLEESPMLEQRQ